MKKKPSPRVRDSKTNILMRLSVWYYTTWVLGLSLCEFNSIKTGSSFLIHFINCLYFFFSFLPLSLFPTVQISQYTIIQAIRVLVFSRGNLLGGGMEDTVQVILLSLVSMSCSFQCIQTTLSFLSLHRLFSGKSGVWNLSIWVSITFYRKYDAKNEFHACCFRDGYL